MSGTSLDGIDALILVISTELLPTNIRGVAISIAFTIGALVGALFVSLFGSLSASLGSLFIPETRGKSLENITWGKK